MADAGPSLDEQKKMILPYMQRAQEIEKADPKMAYYCRLYAIDQALGIASSQRAKEINGLIAAAIGKLEKDKASLSLNKDSDRVQCETLALKVFANADRVDRAGKADASTAKAFLASSYFLDVLNQFGALDADLGSKQKYALWRAAEISKAIREGRPPAPPPSISPRESDAGQEWSASELNASNIAGVNIHPDMQLSGAASMGGPSGGSQGGSGGGYGQPPPGPPAPHAPPPPPPSQGYDFQHQHQASAPPHEQTTAIAPAHSNAPVQPGQRYRPGSRVLFCKAAGVGNSDEEEGTIAQVTRGPDSYFRYRVALRDRLEDAYDMQVAPMPAEDAPVTYTCEKGGPPQPAHVILVNNGMGWPPTYLVQLMDGSEISAQAHELSMIEYQAPVIPPPPVHDASVPTLPPHMHGNAPASDVTITLAAGFSNAGQHAQPDDDALQSKRSFGGMSQDSYSSAQQAQQGHGTSQPLDPNLFSSTGVAPRSSSYQQPPEPSQNFASTWGPGSASATSSYGGAAGQAAVPTFSSSQASQRGHPPPQHSQHTAPATHGAGYISIPAPPPGFKPSMTAMSEAQKAAKTAIHSLNFEDVTSAVRYLTNALELLTNPSALVKKH